MTARKQLEAWVARVVGAVHTSLADSDRAVYGDLAPDVVVWPGAPDEIVSVLHAAREAGAEVAVTGAGTRAASQWSPPLANGKPRIALDTGRLTNILGLDETSLLVESQSGIKLRHLEDSLSRQGMSLGPFPESVFESTLGGILATPPPTATSPSTGPLCDACVGLSVVAPSGRILQTRVAPRRATGPDVARLFVGSGGALGIITSAVLRAQRLPEHQATMAFHTPNATAALKAVTLIFAHGIRPDRLQVMANAEATAQFVQSSFSISAAAALTVSGPASVVKVAQNVVATAFADCGGGELPQEYADRWRSNVLTADKQDGRVCAYFRHTTVNEAITRLTDELCSEGGGPCALQMDQITAHGGLVWVSSQQHPPAVLARALEKAGLRLPESRHSPLAQRLRNTLDPANILISPNWRRES